MHGVKAHIGMWVQDLRTGNPGRNEGEKPGPRQAVPLAPPPERAEPVPDDLATETVQTVHVAGNRVVVKPALDHRMQPLADEGDGVVPPMAKGCLQGLELCGEAFPDRLTLDDEAAGLPGRPAQVRESNQCIENGEEPLGLFVNLVSARGWRGRRQLTYAILAAVLAIGAALVAKLA